MFKTSDKVLELAPLARRCNAWRIRHDEVVFTYGPFDALTVAETRFLEAARQQGHRLVVGVVDGKAETAELLAALFVVDGVVSLQAQELPEALQALRPEVVVSHPQANGPALDAQVMQIVGSRHVTL
jgi:bifunctional ADP-heptose synthase (sugar kinase/adenylyltransferase)